MLHISLCANILFDAHYRPVSLAGVVCEVFKAHLKDQLLQDLQIHF